MVLTTHDKDKIVTIPAKIEIGLGSSINSHQKHYNWAILLQIL